MDYFSQFSDQLSGAGDAMVREWLPASAQAQWSSRFRSENSLDPHDIQARGGDRRRNGSASSSASSSRAASPLTRPRAARGYSSANANTTSSLSRPGRSRGESNTEEEADEEEYSDPSEDEDNAEKGHSRAFSRPADLLTARRSKQGTGWVEKLVAAIVGVWLVIGVIILFGGGTIAGREQVDFDPQRNAIHREKTLVPATDARISYVGGRWSRNKAIGSSSGVLVSTPFGGAYVDVRFTGSSLGIHLGNVDDPVKMIVSVDTDADGDREEGDFFRVLPYGREVVSLVSGLEGTAETEHSVRVMFSGLERVDIEAFYVDKGAGLVQWRGPEKPARPVIEIILDAYDEELLDVQTWPYMLARDLDAERVLIPAPGRCISNCPDGKLALDRYYFLGSVTASRATAPTYWQGFEGEHPRLLVFAIGAGTKLYMERKEMYKNLLPQDASKAYIEAYVELILQIRKKKTHKRTPIVVLRPFDGELEQESQAVVQRLRQRGDRKVHWVDTSFWSSPADAPEDREQKRAVFLAQHVCPFVRGEGASGCEFLVPFEGKLPKVDDEE
ncbi:uncharacterized protein V1518DRAFT_414291 [Limtongia smithiae]|uniref:uncharacterized protein n=1 Tax=Limtongia smithiae TaxID=1125753 RepID=UPI0034CFD0B5